MIHENIKRATDAGIASIVGRGVAAILRPKEWLAVIDGSVAQHADGAERTRHFVVIYDKRAIKVAEQEPGVGKRFPGLASENSCKAKDETGGESESDEACLGRAACDPEQIQEQKSGERENNWQIVERFKAIRRQQGDEQAAERAACGNREVIRS